MKFDEKVKHNIHRIRRMLKYIETAATVVLASIATLYDIGFSTDSMALRVMTSLLQYYFLVVSSHVIAAYDAICMSLCCYVLIQLKLLRAIIRNFAPTMPRSKFVNCVRYHLFILKCVFFDPTISIYYVLSEHVSSDMFNLTDVIYSSEWYGFRAVHCCFPIGTFKDMNMAAFAVSSPHGKHYKELIEY
ncbi:hypothetical protein Trydic_g17466 [Trypoxylus dichotomus]